MRLFQIVERDRKWLSGQPETAMGLQIMDVSEADRTLLIWGGQVAVDLLDFFENDPLPLEVLAPKFSQISEDNGDGEHIRSFQKWLDELPELNVALKGSAPVPAMAFSVFPMGPFPPPPQPPKSIYGHLPFIGLTGTDEAFYRWEPWPISRRVNQKSKRVVPGTFTAPASEVPFMPTGFSAVARLALPGLLPACFRWELRPPANTPTRCGASVPLYGQSGGGVEVAFQNGFSNVGPIANPVILPAL